MKHTRSLKQRLFSSLRANAHEPPRGAFVVGDQVCWSGVDGVVVSVTTEHVQAIFPETGKGVAPIIVKYTTDGRFFPESSVPSLEFICRPAPTPVEIPANVETSSEATAASSDVL